jgi:hypothetical protein
MGYGCMERLSGKWRFSREPFREAKQQDVQLSSTADGNVTGTASFIQDGNTLSFDIQGMYNGAALSIRLTSITDLGLAGFTFDANCKGDNLFDGAVSLNGDDLFEFAPGPCQLKSVG